MARARTAGRRLEVAAVVVAVLGAAGWLALGRLVPQERLAADWGRAVRDRTGAEFTPGEVGVQLLGGPGVVLRGGSLRGTGAELARRTGRANDLGTYAVAWDRLAVRLDTKALLAGDVVVKGVRLEAPRLDLEAGGDRFALRDVELRLEGSVAAVAELPTGSGRGELRVGSLDHDGCPWRDVVLTGAWRDGRSEDLALGAALAGGTLTGDLTLDMGAPAGGRLEGELRLEALPAASVFAPYLPDLAARLRTDLDGTVRGGLDLADRDTRLRTLDLTGRVHGGDGELQARDWLAEVEPYLGDRRDLTTVRFTRLDHEFEVAGQEYRIRRLELEGPDTSWQAAGRVGFDGRLELAVGVLLPAGFTPNLGALSFLAEGLRDDDGRVQLGLKVGGTTAAPRLGLDLSRRR